VATVFPWDEFTPAIKMLDIVTDVLVFMYFVRDLIGVIEEQMGCARNEFNQLGSNRPLLCWSPGHF
jgi:hypothetical protein